MKYLWIAIISMTAFIACEKQLDYVPGEILIAFEETVSEAEAETVITTDLNLTIQKWISNQPNSKIILVDVPKGEENTWIETAQANFKVKYAELNGIVTID